MRFGEVNIESVGCVLPPETISSEAIERRLRPCYDRLGLREGRLELISGIRERRRFPEGTLPSEIAAAAGRDALERAGLCASDVGLLIHASVCRDVLEPATAARVHRRLGLPPSCAFFDLTNACLGFGNAMRVAAERIELGHVEAALIVAGENGGPLLEATIGRLNQDLTLTRKTSKASFASLTIGSGGAAMVLRRRALSATDHRLLGGCMRVDSSASELCRGELAGAGAVGPLMETDAAALMHRGVALAGQVWRATRAELGWDAGDVDRVFTHQVGTVHRRLLFERLEIDPALDFPTVETLGNIGSVSLPISLALGERGGVLRAGHRVALLGIGSGLVCLNLGVRW